jgi:hypothetical protein
MRGKVACEGKAPAHVVRCADDTLDVVLADPNAPAEYEPCTWPSQNPSRRERWRHVDR